MIARIEKNSHFELISGKCLPQYGRRIVQINPNKVYDNEGGYAVFLCEVIDEESEGE